MATKKKVEAKEMITLELTFAPIRVQVDATGSQAEQIERAKKAAQALIAQECPKVAGVSLVQDGALTFETVYPGMLVEDISNPKNKGIVTGINKKTINVTFTGNRNVQGPPQVFKATQVPFEKAASFYKQFTMTRTDEKENPLEKVGLDMFSEGDAGYLEVRAGEFEPVVIGASRGSKYKLYKINGNGRFFEVTELQMKKFFKGTK